MKITKKKLSEAVDKGIIKPDQVDKLLNFLESCENNEPSFNFSHILYYLGGLIAIGAMTYFMTLGWEAWGGYGIVCISLVYAMIGLMLTELFQRKGYAIPAGICATFVVILTPLLIYGIQKALGWWPDETAYNKYTYYIEWHWLYMEFGTLVVGVIMAKIYKYPFLIMPIVVTLCFLSMDVVAMIFHEKALTYKLQSLVSMYFGLLMTLLAFWVDVRARKSADYAFWLYIFGVMTFWGGLTSQESHNELSKFFYFCINLVMIGLGALLVRKVFVIFGGIGACFYLGHLAATIFKDSFLFPIALTAIGFLIIYLGILWQKNEKMITLKARSILPVPLKELLDAKRVQ